MRFRLLPILSVVLCSLALGQDVPGSEAAASTQAAASLAGKSTRLKLLSGVSSKLPKGSVFQARLEQALQVDGQIVLPQGTLFEGHLDPKPARRMIRQGALRLVFDRMILPDGTARPAMLVLSGVRYKAVKMDAEGTIHPRRSKKRLLFQLGGALLIAKVADDIAEVAAASVTQGIARFIGFGAAAAFVLLQKGGEVKVPEGTDIDVTFGRESDVLPLGMPPALQNAAPEE